MSAPTADEALPLLLARSSERPAQLRAVAVLRALSSSRPPTSRLAPCVVRQCLASRQRPDTCSARRLRRCSSLMPFTSASWARTSHHHPCRGRPSSSRCCRPRRQCPPGSGGGAGGDGASQRVGDDDHGAAPSPQRPLQIEAVGRAASHRTACRARRPCLCITLVAADPLRAGMPLHICLPGAGLARHRLPHFTVRIVCVSARAFWRVLRTTASNSVCTPRHSVAVAAPVRRVPQRPSPFA